MYIDADQEYRNRICKKYMCMVRLDLDHASPQVGSSMFGMVTED